MLPLDWIPVRETCIVGTSGHLRTKQKLSSYRKTQAALRYVCVEPRISAFNMTLPAAAARAPAAIERSIANQIKYDFNNSWQTATKLQLVKRDEITVNKRQYILNRNVNT